MKTILLLLLLLMPATSYTEVNVVNSNIVLALFRTVSSREECFLTPEELDSFVGVVERIKPYSTQVQGKHIPQLHVFYYWRYSTETKHLNRESISFNSGGGSFNQRISHEDRKKMAGLIAALELRIKNDREKGSLQRSTTTASEK